MAKRIKTTKQKGTLADMISEACGNLVGLGDECREVVDNMPEALQQGPRGETLTSSADELEQCEEPDVPPELGKMELEWDEWSNPRKGRDLSRADRCAHSVMLLELAIEKLDGEGDERETLREALEEIKDRAEGCEFPGMFG